MMMKLLHALAAVLTVILFLMRRHAVAGRVCLTKRSNYEPTFCLYGDASETSLPRPLGECMVARSVAAAACIMPKYKRDPDIQIDNENIGILPRG